MLFQLAYHSRNAVPGEGEALLSLVREILRVSRPNNARDGLTGYLLFDRNWFVQILEGEPAAVQETLRRISSDPSHRELTIIGERSVQARSFPEWTMGASMRTTVNEEVFLEHGIGSVFDPRGLPFPVILSLAMELQSRARLSRLRTQASITTLPS